MSMTTPFLALRELRRNWPRFLLAGFALASGVAILVASDLLSRAITAEIARIEEVETVTAFMTEQMNVGLTVIGLVISAAAGFLVLNTTLMSVHARTHEISRLRALGMVRAQLARLLLIETLTSGVPGILLGIPAGFGLNAAIIGLLEATSPMFNRFAQPTPSPARIVLAAGIGLIVSCLAAWLPIRRALRQPPIASRHSLETMKPRIETRPLLGSGLIVAALAVFLFLGRPYAWLLPPWSGWVILFACILWVGVAFATAPAWAGFGAWLTRPLLARLFGMSGRLAAENLGRSRGRVSRTVITLAVGVAMVVGVSGFLAFWFDELFFRNSERSLLERPALGVFPIDVEGGLEAYEGVTSFTVSDSARAGIRQAVGAEAAVVEAYYAVIPELSFLGEQYFSFLLDPHALRDSGSLFFSFSEGDWEHALPIMEKGCGVLLTRSVAGKNGVGLYDTLTVSTAFGPLTCRVAGIGPTFVGASIVSTGAAKFLHLESPVTIAVFPFRADRIGALQRGLESALASEPGMWILDLGVVTEMQREGMKSAQVMMNSMLLLAILTASLGVLNTVQINLREREREFALLRAVGATRRQVAALVMLESALYGLLGGLLGLITGAGLIVLYIVIAGGNAFGFIDFPVAEAVWNTLGTALGSGLLALAAAPLFTILAALPAVRSLSRRSATEILRRVAT